MCSGIRVARRQLDGAVGQPYRLRAIAELGVPMRGANPRHVVEDCHVVGLDFQCLLVIGDGLVHSPAESQGSAEAVVNFGEIGLDFQRLLIIGNGLGQQSAAKQDVAEVAVGLPGSICGLKLRCASR